MDEIPCKPCFVVANMASLQHPAPVDSEGHSRVYGVRSAADEGIHDIKEVLNLQIGNAEGGSAGPWIDMDASAVNGCRPKDALGGGPGVVIVHLIDQTLVSENVQSNEDEGPLPMSPLDVNILAVHEAQVCCPEEILRCPVTGSPGPNTASALAYADGTIEVSDQGRISLSGINGQCIGWCNGGCWKVEVDEAQGAQIRPPRNRTR
jgi:hypothetical protein